MMLQTLIGLGWKSAFIAALALLADRAMRGRPAAERVFVLRVAVIALLLLPVAVMLLPSVEFALLPAPEAVVATARTHAIAPAAPAALPDAEAAIDLFGLLYGLGAAAVMLHLAIGLSVLARWTRRGVHAGDAQWQAALTRGTVQLRRPVRLLVSDHIATPISWGIAPAWILIDRVTLARKAQADAVIAHEMAHVRRFDWPMLVAARIALALLWFNPLVWMLSRALAHRGETAADEAAVRQIERADYAEALLSFATAPSARGMAVGMALWPDALAERITHIATHRYRRGSRVTPVVAITCFVVAAPLLAAARLVPAAPDTERQMERIAAPAQTAVPELRTVAPESPSRARAVNDTGAAVERASVPPTNMQTVLPAGRQAAVPSPIVRVANPPQPRRVPGQADAGAMRMEDGEVILLPPPPQRGEDRPEWADHVADELTAAAAEIRRGARDVELSAELPDVSAGRRAEIAKRAREMRAKADAFEARARALRGPGG